MSERTVQWALVLIFGLYLVLSLTCSFVNPAFEAPDEWYHYRFIRDLIETHRLPIQELGQPKSQSHHPPLYYVVGALLTFWIDDDAGQPEENPYWGYQAWRIGGDNKRLYLETGADAAPCRDRCLAVHLLRVYSVALGALTILVGYLALGEVFDDPAYVVGALAFLALNPMFIYMSSAISNDNMITFLGTLALWLALRAVNRGISMTGFIVAGLVAGLATLTKVSGVMLLPLFWLSYILAFRGERRWRHVLVGVIITTAVACCIFGWWIVRNLILYGELTGVNRMLEIWGGRPPKESLLLVQDLPYLWTTFWGRFGYGQIPLPSGVYIGLGMVTILALFGLAKLVLCARNRANAAMRRRLLLLVVASGFLLALTIGYMRLSPTGANGRYMFPTLVAVTGLLFFGLAQLVPSRLVHALAMVAMGAMAILSIVALTKCVIPAYARPASLTPEQVATLPNSTEVRFGESIRLIGYDIDRGSDHEHGWILPGDELTVMLCWEALAPMEKDYAYFVHILGLQESKIGARDTYPGLGNYFTRNWIVGDAFCDVVRVPVETWAPAPAVYNVVVGWYLYEEGQIKEHLPAYDASGAPLELVTLGKIKVRPESYAAVEVPNRLDANLGGQVTLLGYEVNTLEVAPGEAVDITLYWAAQVAVPADYTVFLHLAAPEGPPYAQADGQPQHSAYPTSFWDAGEVVRDARTIVVPTDLPPGEYPLVAGMYLLETGERLRWLTPDGSDQGDAVPLATLTVRAGVP